MFVASIVIGILALGDAADLRANSNAGAKLLKHARKLNDNNNYYNWVKDYSIKFTGCAKIPKVDEDEGGMTSTVLAQFSLCPSDSCGDSCKEGGEYVADMNTFVQAQQEAIRTHIEYECEVQLNKCENKCGGDDDGCEYQCMAANDMSSCYNEQEEEGDYEEMIDCKAMDGDNGYAKYYTGAYCTDEGVFLDTFTDASCTEVAPEGTFYSMNGYSLPTSSIVAADSCTSCMNQDAEQNDDYYNNAYAMEICTELYAGSSKCEENVDTENPDNSGCELIEKVIPALNGDGKKVKSHKGAAWFFFLTSMFLGAYAMSLQKKLQRSSSDYTGGRFS